MIILEIDPKYLEFIKNDIERFKLQIKTPNSLKEKENFLKFYSGGPSQTLDQPIFVSIIFNSNLLFIYFFFHSRNSQTQLETQQISN